MEVWIEMSEEPMDARSYVTSTVLAMGGSPGDAAQPHSSSTHPPLTRWSLASQHKPPLVCSTT